jgi:hypothetical protein
MANIEKHRKVKKIRQESKELVDTKIIDRWNFMVRRY